MINNHPTIHCNRFPAWENLSEEKQDKLIQERQEELESGFSEGENEIIKKYRKKPVWGDDSKAARDRLEKMRREK